MSTTLRLPLTSKAAQRIPVELRPVAKPVAKAISEQKAAKLAQDQIEKHAASARRRADSDALFAVLVARYPLAFNKVAPLPLAIGVDKVIRAELDGPSKRLHILMHWWTRRQPYIRALAAGGPRYNLDGSEAGLISDEQQAVALLLVRPRRALAPDHGNAIGGGA